ncbi:glycosyl transferase [Desulfosporosinus acidiphilus SJ4]|uniref:Glycosyl transferase n=1 Tax=Desulfosporosinus acidiphilus (strain DSM 22704 / JCM 16185 / SJ4) TaxID=646529 RepID=I4D920_DESAJ|nr:glycosyltransferase [Desulfosporosinus acidiphilus]AFM42294.1 glycosyl transferase [Desulfosporosinus acidiphilus SJ4]
MNYSIQLSMVVVFFLSALNLVIIGSLLYGRLHNSIAEGISLEQQRRLLKLLSGKIVDLKQKGLIINYLNLRETIELNEQTIGNVNKAVDIFKSNRNYLQKLKSRSRIKRIEAAVFLGFMGNDAARIAMEKAILREKDYPVKLYIANALTEIADPESLPVLVSSLKNSHRWYRERVNMLISDFGDAFNAYLTQISGSELIEIKELIVDFASVNFSETVKDYLLELIDCKEEAIKKLQTLYGASTEKACRNCIFYAGSEDQDKGVCKFQGAVSSSYVCQRHQVLPVSVNYKENYTKLVYKAADILARYYPKVLDHPKYLSSEDIELRNLAIQSLANIKTLGNLTKVLSLLNNEGNARSVVNSVTKIIERNPSYIHVVVKQFEKEKDSAVRLRLSEILANKIAYFIMKLGKQDGKAVGDIIKQVILLGHTSEVIDFLNKNKDLDLENELLAIIKDVIRQSDKHKNEFKRYLNERLVHKCGLIKTEEIPAKKEEQKDWKLIRSLYLILFSILVFFPTLYCLRHQDILFTAPLAEQVKLFVIDFNYYLAYYSITINLIYLTLLALSYVNVKKQLKLWRIKSLSLLFKPKMLPTISIIAPAYNEEKTIIESANSLLNLKYPDYELVIVNDGSKDNTLEVLINYFDLMRVDYVFDNKLNTKPIRGVYQNRSIPKLIVVDKDNGGKADSLNAGINISNKEYFCGIDADSLLEDDALLKLASLTLDKGVETPALGGNIFPINGCTIERGQIKDVRIPENPLARFQTIEYIRAFMAGRLGWALTNSLLIISGAFGLFRKERVISVGGYLTSSGKYAKDTVGEDMELVVRISRLMRELGQNYRICYAFNANCWTEVPEDLESLKKQRYRWHKGLIDILTFHKTMLFNPRYGRIGIVAMPYFLFFEMIGPLLEALGYLMVIAAFILGLLNAQIALLLFISTILMGVLVSVSSLLIAEKDKTYFKLRDIMLLIIYAIIENFGPRQLFSLWRVGGYLNMLKKPGGWDKPVRRGFTAKV